MTLMYVATTQHLNNSRQDSKKVQFAVYISDTPVTLKESQDHQTYNEYVDPKQAYNLAKLEDLTLTMFKKKEMLNFFQTRK